MLVLMYGYVHDRTGNGNNAQQVGMTYEHYFRIPANVITHFGGS
ncbi:hypothetical protein [Burkholderia multivorans]|nr:hypothetical protein [Burkholderia multivorans]